MAQITWGEFKRIVEDAQVKDETPIRYIDINGYEDHFNIYHDDNNPEGAVTID